MATVTIKSVSYIDPWGIAPPGMQTALVVTALDPVPPNSVLAVCLIDATGRQLASGVAASSSAMSLRVVPPAPLSSDESYQAWIQWAPIGTTPQWPAPDMLVASVLVSIPTITSAVVAANTLSATWAFGPGAGGTAGAGLWIYDPSVAGGTLAAWLRAGGSSGTAKSDNVTLDPTKSYVAYIQGIQPALPTQKGGFVEPYSFGPFSAPIPVTIAAPAITSVAFDGAFLTVGWNPVTLPATSPLPDATTYTLCLLDGTTILATLPASPNGAVAAVNLPLANRTINVAGAVALGPFQAPLGRAQAPLLVAPSIVRATVPGSGASTVVVTLAPMTQASSATITAELLEDGIVVATVAAAGSPLQASFTTTLTAGDAYAVRAYASVGAANGSPSFFGPATPLVDLTLATITTEAIRYDGSNLVVSWPPVGDAAVTGYEVNLTVNSVVTTVTTPETVVAIPIALAPGAVCSLTVCALTSGGRGRGPTSTASSYTVPAPTTPAITGCTFDASNVRVSWSPSTGPGLDGYAITVTGKADSSTVSDVTLTFHTGLDTQATFPLPLDDTPRLWTVSVSPTVGSFTGPASPAVPICTAVPALSGLTLATPSGTLTATFTWTLTASTTALLAALQSANAQLYVHVLDNGDPIATQSIAITSTITGTASVTIPSSASQALALAARMAAPSIAGPLGGAVPVLSVTPTVIGASYDGTWLSLEWNGVAAGTIGHTVVLQPTAGSAITLAAGASPSLLVPVALDLTATWTATIQPIGVNSRGLTTAATTVGLPTVAAPRVTLTRYDNGVLTVGWTAASPGATYVLTVTGGAGGAISQHAGPALSLAFPIDLQSGSTYTVTVQAFVGAAAGPTSSAGPIELAVISAGTLTTDPIAGTATLTWTGPTGATGYKVRVSINGEVEDEVDVSAASMVVPLPPGATAAAAVAVVTTSGTTTAIGPYSAPIVLPTVAPTVLTAAWDGTLLATSWSEVAGCSQYQVNVVTATALKFSTTVASSVTQAVVNPQITDTTATYAVAVQALFGASSGPTSPAVTLLLAAPTASATAFDGHTLTVTVAAPATGPAITGYDVTVLGNGQPMQTATAPASATSTSAAIVVTVPIDPAAVYTVSVRGRAGTATGQAAAAIAAMFVSPVVTSVVFAATKLTVTAVPGPLPASGLTMSAVLITDGVAGTAQTLTNGSTQFDLPTGTAYAVAVRGQAGSATGPWSTPVPAVIAAPAALSATLANGVLACAYSGNPAARYAITLTTSGGQTVLQMTVEGLSASVPFAPVTGTAYTLNVAAVAGVAEGAVVSLPLVTDGCAISKVIVAGDRTATITFTAPGAPATIDKVQPIVSIGPDAVMLPAVDATSPLTLPLPASIPNGAVIALRAIAGASIGPIGNATPLLTVAPTGLALAFALNAIQAAWDPAPDGIVDGYAVTLSVTGSQPATSPATEPSCSIAYTPADPPQPATVTVAFTSGVGTGPASAAVPIVTEKPSLQQATYDDGMLSLKWSAPTDTHVTATKIALSLNGVVAQQVTVGGNVATLDVPPAPWTVTVQEIGTATAGPPSDSVSLITAAPAISSIAFGSASPSDCAVQWPAVTGATVYDVHVLNGLAVVLDTSITPAAGNTVSDSIPATTFTDAAGSYSLRVRARPDAHSVAAGPWSAPLPIPAIAPGGVEVVYDGVAATVSWNALALPLLSGYQLTTTVSGAPQPLGRTVATSGRFALTNPLPADTIAVQAIVGSSLGPASTAVPVLGTGLFLSTGAATAPHIALRTSLTGADSAITVNLPNIFAATPSGALPSTPPFVLTAQSGAFPYALTFPVGSIAWTFDGTSIRSALLTAYQTFLGALATLGATPIGIRTVQDAIARAMPQTFVETLYYAYGLMASQGYVDLRPGMILRAEYEAYQVPATHSPDSGFLDGFVTSGRSQYEIASFTNTGAWLTGLDAFLAQLVAGQGVTVPAMPPDAGGRSLGAGGAIDAFFTQFLRPFCRLVYPPGILPQDSTGSPYAYLNPVLIAASNLADLETATTNVRAGVAPGGSVASFYFRGRVTLTASIRVLVNGVPMIVPLGTTIGNVLASVGARPPIGGLPLQALTLRRPQGAAITSPQPDITVGGGWNVRLDWASGLAPYSAISDWLDLPLLGGDRLAFAGWDA